MVDLGTKSNTDQYEKQISEIIQGELIDLYGVDIQINHANYD
jgi:hypothetical protein